MIITPSSARRVTASRPEAFTLVEVTLALGIAVFCLVTIFGLLNVGVAASAASFEQTVATNILSSVAADLRAANRSTAAVSTTVYGLAIPAPAQAGASPSASALPVVYLDASGQVSASAAQAHYRLNVWMKPGTDRQATFSRVMVSWPPLAATPAGAVETLVALDRN